MFKNVKIIEDFISSTSVCLTKITFKHFRPVILDNVKPRISSPFGKARDLPSHSHTRTLSLSRKRPFIIIFTI